MMHYEEYYRAFRKLEYRCNNIKLIIKIGQKKGDHDTKTNLKRLPTEIDS